ncbi:MAG: hypothetical protein AAB726_01850 [Patescibacteria group bacterium]
MPKLNKINLLLTICVTFFLISAVWGSIELLGKNKAKTRPFLAASAIYSSDVNLSPEILPVVASKNGTKYYLSSCGAVGRIKAENLVTFATWQAAEAKGFEPAQNCADLEDYLSEFSAGSDEKNKN